MDRPVIITGPQGCGKTLNAGTLAQAVGCATVVDGWVLGDDLLPGALHLTFEPMERLVVAITGGAAPVIREYAQVAMECGLLPDPSDLAEAAPAVVVTASDFSAGEYLARADFEAAQADVQAEAPPPSAAAPTAPAAVLVGLVPMPPEAAETDPAGRDYRAEVIRLCIGDLPPECGLCGAEVTPDNLVGADEDGNLYCIAHGGSLLMPGAEG